MYFDKFVDVEGETPSDHLRDLIGSDDGLIRAVLEGFRGSIRRTEGLTDAEFLRLRSEDQIHLLALPIMAGLEEAARDEAAGKVFLDEREMRLALTIHYATPVPRSANRSPNWFRLLLKSHPEIVADVLVRSVRSKMEGGQDFREDLYDLVGSPEHAVVARLVSVPDTASLTRRHDGRCLSPHHRSEAARPGLPPFDADLGENQLSRNCGMTLVAKSSIDRATASCSSPPGLMLEIT